jgi:hypothetical protein
MKMKCRFYEENKKSLYPKRCPADFSAGHLFQYINDDGVGGIRTLVPNKGQTDFESVSLQPLRYDSKLLNNNCADYSVKV